MNEKQYRLELTQEIDLLAENASTDELLIIKNFAKNIIKRGIRL